MAVEGREFKNLFEPWDPNPGSSLHSNLGMMVFDQSTSIWQPHPSFEPTLKRWLDNLLSCLESWMPRSADWDDQSVYTGTAGIILMYLHLHSITDQPHMLQGAASLLKRLQLAPERSGSSSRRQVSLHCGEAGVLAVTAAVEHRQGHPDKAAECVQRVLHMAQTVETSRSMCDELLYGRAGYLAALLYIRQQLGADVPNLQSAMKKTVAAILNSGQQRAKEEKSPCPLMYVWHDKHYLGAAHGLSGIMTLLMQVPELLEPSALRQLVRPTVDHLISLRLPSGNYPSSLESVGSDRLVHWCHGAPGFSHMLCLAYKTFGDDRYLQLARECAALVWRRGLLRKGYGLCHGAAGNAYTFVHVYQLTKDPQYLYWALRFAEWCSEYGQHGCRTPDRPLSLFEGVAGTVCFLADMLRPDKARFPGFCF